MKMDCFSPRSAVAVAALLALLFAGCETKKQASQPGGSQYGKATSTASEGSGEAGTGAVSTASSAKEKFGSVSFTGLVKVTGTA
ncbi:MAG: hypothetical protein VX496_08890, partial [Planctomycetota bacterium]|nr:hypothetical protein [Planctomycetota bacterium]